MVSESASANRNSSCLFLLIYLLCFEVIFICMLLPFLFIAVRTLIGHLGVHVHSTLHTTLPNYAFYWHAFAYVFTAPSSQVASHQYCRVCPWWTSEILQFDCQNPEQESRNIKKPRILRNPEIPKTQNFPELVIPKNRAFPESIWDKNLLFFY